MYRPKPFTSFLKFVHSVVLAGMSLKVTDAYCQHDGCIDTHYISLKISEEFTRSSLYLYEGKKKNR